jgi:predicted N-acyltransferase
VTRALESLDFARARTLLAEHERSFAADGWHERRRGYELVLSCLEHRDQRDQFTAAAERYLQEERISPLRRSVRRVCLEGRGFHRRT